MRLLLTADPIGGVWTYALELCANLKHYGVRIALATMGRRLSAGQYREVARLPHVELFESRYRLCWMDDPWEDVSLAGRWLLAVAEGFRPDLVHLNDLAHGALNWRVPVLLVGHSCVLSWWQAVHGVSAPAEWQRYRAVVQESLQQADLVVAPSAAMLAALTRQYGPRPAARVIANGRDYPPVVSPGAKAAHARNIIFTAGRLWDQAKNIALLAAIAEELDWPVLVAGEEGQPRGTAAPALQQLGYLSPEELAQWMTRAAIFVAPARYEPFGLSILEAARAGCALVLGDIDSLREIWEDSAVYVDPDRPEALLAAIRGLIDDPAGRRQLTVRSRRRAQWFTGSRMTAAYMHCYQHLLGKFEQENRQSRVCDGGGT